jgi:hypothetical protein
MRLRITAIAVLLLAGCGSRSDNQQAGGNQQAAAPAATAAPAGGGSGLTIQPGLWEITMEMRLAQATEMPAGMTLPQMPPTTVRSCVTPEQVSRANANFLSGSGHAGINCDYSGVTVAGGRIHGTSTCSRPGTEVSVTMDGSFTPTSYDINQQMQSTGRGRTMSSTNHLVGRRVGECPPGQANAVSGPGNSLDGR